MTPRFCPQVDWITPAISWKRGMACHPLSPLNGFIVHNQCGSHQWKLKMTMIHTNWNKRLVAIVLCLINNMHTWLKSSRFPDQGQALAHLRVHSRSTRTQLTDGLQVEEQVINAIESQHICGQFQLHAEIWPSSQTTLRLFPHGRANKRCAINYTGHPN